VSLSGLWRLRGWVLAVVILVLVVFVRRWIHHAQLESQPVLVPAGVPAADVVSPPVATIARRMALEVRDAFAPPRRERLAVLTFDDGPYPVTTPMLLAQLRALHVPATFFVIGRDATEQPAITIRARAAGIELGNHTQTHPEMNALPVAEQEREIAAGADSIAALTDERPQFFRPPHGNYDAATVEAARAQGETVALWDVDPGDWRSLTADQIAALVLGDGRAPAVILLHNGKPATVEALSRIVAAYRNAGFEFVTLAELRRRMPIDSINDPVPVALTRS
jgi:peptidoglycan/xylan/chitin deacetylase (PgdA/CDA1 family)